MNDLPALVAAIRAQPDEDTPRLAAADWFDEHGRPERAAFVRLGVELARREATPPDGPCRCYLLPAAESEAGKVCGPCSRRRAGIDAVRVPVEAALWEHEPRWFPWLRNRTYRNVGSYESPLWDLETGGLPVFVRGFADRLVCEPRGWVHFGDEIREAEPVAHVLLRGVPRVASVHGPDGPVDMLADDRRPVTFRPLDVGREMWVIRDGRNGLAGPDDHARALLLLRYPGTRFYLPGDEHLGVFNYPAGPPPCQPPTDDGPFAAARRAGRRAARLANEAFMQSFLTLGEFARAGGSSSPTARAAAPPEGPPGRAGRRNQIPPSRSPRRFPRPR